MKKILSTLLIVSTLAGSVSGMVFGTCCAESPEEIKLAKAIVSEIVQKNKTDEEKRELNKSKIRNFITKNKGYLPDDKIPQIKRVLMALSLEELENILDIELTSPELIQVISIFLGIIGIDRLLIGSYGMFLLKFFTAGNFGILWLYDVCTIKGKVREKNYNKLMSILSDIC